MNPVSMNESFTTIRFRMVSQATRVLPGKHQEYDSVQQTIGIMDSQILVGVGSDCFGNGGSKEMVFDHRFDRFPGPHATNFPSTSLTIIYHAREIADWARSLKPGQTVTICTRHDPEFDACLAVYLVKRIIEEPEIGTGWAAKAPDETGMIPPPALLGTVPRGKPAFRWRQPEIPLEDRNPLDASRRALLWLAIVASHIEQNRPIDGPPDRSVDHLFLAAKHRRRFVGADASSFFQSIEKRIIEDRFQPMYDGFSAEDPEFAGEMRLLDRQRQLYNADLQRSRRAIVFLARSQNPISNWSNNITVSQDDLSTPDFLEILKKEVRESQDAANGKIHERVPVDGLFVRDPHCLFFRWFARSDRENSRLGQGFLFLGVAQSLTKRADTQRPNRSRYRFSIDSEWARNQKVHLQDLWGNLQERELALNLPNSTRTDFRLERSRTGIRVNSPEIWLFGLGNNGSLVEAPLHGTMLREGSRADLSDDEAGYLVWDYLTSRGFEDSQPQSYDFPWAGRKPLNVEIQTDASINETDSGGFRFVRICRKAGASDPDQLRDSINAQIAERLWEWIQPVGTRGIPDDFSQRHLIHRGEWVGVWNRQGIAIAHADTPGAKNFVDRLQGEIKELARLTGEIRNLLHDTPQGNNQEIWHIEKKLHQGTEALARLAELHLRAQAGQSPVLRPFMEANGIMELASMVESMNRIRIQEKVEAQERRRDDRLQQTIAVASAVAIFLAWLQVERVGLVGGDRTDGLFDGSPRAWVDTAFGAAVAMVFLFWSYRRIKRWG